MLIRVLALVSMLTAAAFLSACDSSTDVANPMLQIIPDREFTLTGGGWRVEGQDTMIAYSTDISFTVKTTRADNALMTLGLEVGAMVNGEFTTDPQFVLVDTASLNAINNKLTVIGGNLSTVNITADHIILGRPRSAGWSYPYAWRVRYNDGTSDIEKTGTFKGSVQGNRWRGVLYTLENSPEPVGLLDGPDEADWSASSSLLSSIGAYPNPVQAYSFFALSFSPKQTTDSVIVEYLQTPTRVLHRFLDEATTAGHHTVNISTESLPLGLGRVRIRAYSGSTVAEAHGDVYILND